MKKSIITITSLFFVPATALAQVKTGTIKSIANSLTDFLSTAVMPMLFAVALGWFIWGIVEFIRKADNPEDRKKGKARMLWGIIGLFAMITFLSLTGVLTNSIFGVSQPILPQLFQK